MRIAPSPAEPLPFTCLSIPYSLSPSIWHIIHPRNHSAVRCLIPASVTAEAAMLKPLLFVSAIVLLGITASSAPGPEPQKAARASASDQKNPVKPTEKSQARAKELYGQDCSICHGETGDGKTDLAKDMGLTLSDWTDPKTLAASRTRICSTSSATAKARCLPRPWAAPRTTKCGTSSLHPQPRQAQPAAAPETPAAPVAPVAPIAPVAPPASN
jgi:cytochrome c1